MKLSSKYNRINIFAAIMVLLISSFCYYFILRYVLINQLDDDLKIEEQEILDFRKKHNALPVESSYKDQQINFAIDTTALIQRKFFSQNIYNRSEHGHELTRILVFPVAAGGKNYAAKVSKSQEGTEDLLRLIVLITVGVVILLLVILFLVNRFLFNKLWLPFNKALSELKKFNLSKVKKAELEQSNIDEFNELNVAINIMVNRVIQDYDSLKDFTENASHEIQTPLAIIKSKLELLIQSENLGEEQIQNIQTASDAANRLSKLNQSLLLLTKIENYQFSETREVNIAAIIRKIFYHYEELILAKKLIVIKKINDSENVFMNETLAEILISNLVTNAIKHNHENGAIEVVLSNKELIISNTGNELKADPALLFERFKKDNTKADSLGLGLSIVKKITEQYNFMISYCYTGGLHIITINF